LRLLIEEARVFRRAGASALPPGIIREVVAGLFGVRADAEGGRFELSPWVPDGWRTMALRRLRCHRTLLDIEIRPRAEWATVRLEVTFGPTIALALSLRNVGPIGRVTVDEVALEGNRAIFTASGEHEVMFFFEGVERR
jgi:hypothetical protein